MSSKGDFREKMRGDVDRMYPEILKALEEAVGADRTQWGNCPECKHRVAVNFPDFPGRVKAMQFLVEAGYGKPPETVAVTVGLEADVARWLDYFDRMTPEERAVMLGFLQREEGLQRALPVGDDQEGQDGDEGQETGGLSANGVAHA